MFESTVIDFKLELAKTLFPIFFTFSVILIVVNLLHLEKALAVIISTLSSILTSVIFGNATTKFFKSLEYNTPLLNS